MATVTSTRKARANRRNAAGSRGPTSLAGRARSAQNALTHGLLARRVVIADALGESREDFHAVLSDLVAELQPTNVVEESLVERIAVCYWRLHRAQRFEADAIRAGLLPDENHEHKLKDARSRLHDAEQDLALELRLVALLDRPVAALTQRQARERQHSVEDFARAYGLNLRAALKKTDPAQRVSTTTPTRGPGASCAPDTPERAASDSHSREASRAKRAEDALAATAADALHAGDHPCVPAHCDGGFDFPVGHAPDYWAREEEVRRCLPNVIDRMRRNRDRLKAQVQNLERQAERAGRRRDLNASLPDEANLRKLVRYETMLDRQLYRALAELRHLRDRSK